MRVLTVSGSLQARSTNRTLLELAATRAPDGDIVEHYDALAEIPAFNPDLDPALPVIAAWRGQVASADAVLIATPEYAFGLPGALKNALDWLVGTGELYGKIVAIISGAPSPERGAHARADLERTLQAQGASVVDSRTIARSDDADHAIDEVLRAFSV
jgi:NAD(P)H-dependent FMN reductase